MHRRGGKRKGAGRPKSEPTTTIRVPVGCLDAVKDLVANYKDGNDTYEVLRNGDPRLLNARLYLPSQLDAMEKERLELQAVAEKEQRELIEKIKEEFANSNRLTRRTLLSEYGSESKVIDALYIEAMADKAEGSGCEDS